MNNVTLKGTSITLDGNFPRIGQHISDFELTADDLSDALLKDFTQPVIILNIFPSLDTSTCSMSVKKFNDAAASLPNCTVLCVSKDLPFAQSRFCGAENIKNVKVLSAFRSKDFGPQFGVGIVDGPLRGLLARSVIVLDSDRNVVYAELVPEIIEEPNYDKCLKAVAAIPQ